MSFELSIEKRNCNIATDTLQSNLVPSGMLFLMTPTNVGYPEDKMYVGQRERLLRASVRANKK